MPIAKAPQSRRAQTTGGCRYNARLIKGGALLEDMRLLVRNWKSYYDEQVIDITLMENLLSRYARSRVKDVIYRIFLSRFVNGSPQKAWKIVRELEDRNVSIEILRPVYYWITARNESLIYDFVCDELLFQNERQEQKITTDAVVAWLEPRLSMCGKTWSEAVTKRVARGILATLRDFGILEGAVKKRIAPVYTPVESFVYIAFAIWREGRTGINLVNHDDWKLFLLQQKSVESMFLEADRYGFLRYQAAGGIARVDFSFNEFREMANAIATRTY